jgi:hypothetical protein
MRMMSGARAVTSTVATPKKTIDTVTIRLTKSSPSAR